MLFLALVGLLAATDTPALPRVPGTRFRLGMPESEVAALRHLSPVKGPEARGMTALRGGGRFFGVPGEVTCYLRSGVLAEFRFDATGVSPHSLDYVDGQLRRMSLERRCERDEHGDRDCDWLSPAIKAHIEMKGDRLAVRVERWPPQAAARTPQTAGGRAPRAAGGAPGARSDAPGARGGGAGTAGDASARAARKNVSVVTLPETLSISLASRNSPAVWPRIVSSPRLDYPEEARRLSVQGVVWVLAVVEPDGSVSDAWIERSILELDTAALAWVSRCRFAPCERDDRPCRFFVRVAVRFTLH